MNKIKNYIYRLLFLCGVITFGMSCENEQGAEKLFEDVATVRISKEQQELKDLLTNADQGWKVTYFTNGSKFGGFTMLMKFDKENNVEMTSDINSETEAIVGQYDIKMGNTVKLSFSTFNHIHKLVDSYFPSALRGRGYEGSGEFYYYGQEAERLLFKSVRYVDPEKIEFVKATKEDWDNLIEESMEMATNLKPGPEDSVYTNITVTQNNQETIYPYNLDDLRRFISMTGKTSEGSLVDKSFGIAYTPVGLNVFPPIELQETTFDSFTYDEEHDEFIATVEGTTAKLGFSDQPANISDDVLDIGIKFNRFWYDPTWGTNPLTSAGFDALIDEVNKNLSVFNVRFSRLRIYVDQNEPGLSILEISASGNLARYAYNTEIKDSKFYMKYVGPDNSIGAILEPHLEPLRSFFGSSKGLYYTNEGSFKSDDNNYSNSSGTFTSAESPNIRLYGLWY